MVKRPRICHLGPSLSAVSGVSTHLLQLFGSRLGVKYELLHFQIGSEGRREKSLGKFWRLLRGPIDLMWFVLCHRPQIVQVNTSLEPKSYWRDIGFVLVSKLLRCRVVYQVHGGALPQEFFAGRPRLEALLRRVLSMPDVVVLLAQVELQAYRSFVPRQRLEVVPNAIETAGLDRSRQATGSAGTLQLVYVGRLADDKGVFDTIDALAVLVGESVDLHLTVAGGGPDEARLRQRVQDAGLGARVRFAGPVFGADKDALWCSSDVFVFPTFHREGLPYALLEAMAAGAVPVTTQVGAIPDVMQHEVHGLFVPPRDVRALVRALARLHGDRALLLRLAQAGRARVVGHYGVSRLADDFDRVYTDLLGKSRCAASRDT